MAKHLSAQHPEILADTDLLSVEVLGPHGRVSLRARGDLSAFDIPLGLSLPRRIGQRASREGMEALQLGPDEWVLVLHVDEVGALLERLTAIYGEHPHSAVDLSGREITFRIEGPGAAELLSIGCPRDIASIPEGEARRTVFDGVTVILWHDAEDRFRMDVWNSFAPHVAQLLAAGSRELATEAEISANQTGRSHLN